MTEPYRVYHHAKKCKAEHTERCEAECGEYVPKHEMDAEIARLTKKLEQAERERDDQFKIHAAKIDHQNEEIGRLTGELEEAKDRVADREKAIGYLQKAVASNRDEAAALRVVVEAAKADHGCAWLESGKGPCDVCDALAALDAREEEK